MKERFVIDTTTLINYFSFVFNEENRLSKRSKHIIESSLSKSGDYLVVVPSIVFIEIQRKWFDSEEFAKKFFYEVFIPIKSSIYFEIKPIEAEVIENVLIISGNLKNHEIHDKIILASAMMLQCPLISSDEEIKSYVNKTGVIPEIFF